MVNPIIVSRDQLRLAWDDYADGRYESWILRRSDRLGKVHVAYGPWTTSSPCGSGRATNIFTPIDALVFQWVVLPRQDGTTPAIYCRHCRYKRPWRYLLPDKWRPPETVEDCLVIADFWEEIGEEKKAASVRHIATFR